jgi:hypothetical protein
VVRAAALLAIVAVLAEYYVVADDLPVLSDWPDVALIALGLLPAAFLAVWLALPLWRSKALYLGAAALGLGVVTLVLELTELETAANFTKFAAVVAAAWWFLVFFETVAWVLLVAVLIIPVDIVSVFRGPTKVIVEEQPEVFSALSIAFPTPGDGNSAQLGLPDVLFFTLFLGAAARFGLRIAPTWVAMVLSFGATLALAIWQEEAGLPALPLLSLAFALVNADLLWRDLRSRRSSEAA